MRDKLCEYIRENFSVSVDVIRIAANVYDKACRLYSLNEEDFDYDGVIWIADILEPIGITAEEIGDVLMKDFD